MISLDFDDCCHQPRITEYIIEYKTIGFRMLSDRRTAILRAFQYPSDIGRYLRYLRDAETLYGDHLAAVRAGPYRGCYGDQVRQRNNWFRDTMDRATVLSLEAPREGSPGQGSYSTQWELLRRTVRRQVEGSDREGQRGGSHPHQIDHRTQQAVQGRCDLILSPERDGSHTT